MKAKLTMKREEEDGSTSVLSMELKGSRSFVQRSLNEVKIDLVAIGLNVISEEVTGK